MNSLQSLRPFRSISLVFVSVLSSFTVLSGIFSHSLCHLSPSSLSPATVALEVTSWSPGFSPSQPRPYLKPAHRTRADPCASCYTKPSFTPQERHNASQQPSHVCCFPSSNPPRFSLRPISNTGQFFQSVCFFFHSFVLTEFLMPIIIYYISVYPIRL